MYWKLPIILSVVLSTCLVAKSEDVFGNSSQSGNAFSLAFESGNSWGGAVGFTPTENLEVTGVTLALSNYTGQNDITPEVSIWGNQSIPYGPDNQPNSLDQIASLTAPAPNNGSVASFTFGSATGPIEIQANQEYWIFVSGSWDGEGNFGEEIPDPTWVMGSAPTGDATYDGSESFINGGFSSSCNTPAFSIDVADTIQPVPEPSFWALMTLPLLFVALKIFRKDQKLCPVKVSRPFRKE
jgi:hypothetical protein